MKKSKCGFLCLKCPVFIATQNNDINALKMIIKQLQSENSVKLRIEDILCDGCNANKRLFYYCYECNIRNND